MNKTRLKEVKRALGLLEEAQGILESAATDERGEYDDLSERAQESERGQARDAIASSLESALESVEAAAGELGNIEGVAD